MECAAAYSADAHGVAFALALAFVRINATGDAIADASVHARAIANDSAYVNANAAANGIVNACVHAFVRRTCRDRARNTVV